MAKFCPLHSCCTVPYFEPDGETLQHAKHPARTPTDRTMHGVRCWWTRLSISKSGHQWLRYLLDRGANLKLLIFQKHLKLSINWIIITNLRKWMPIYFYMSVSPFPYIFSTCKTKIAEIVPLLSHTVSFHVAI